MTTITKFAWGRLTVQVLIYRPLQKGTTSVKSSWTVIIARDKDPIVSYERVILLRAAIRRSFPIRQWYFDKWGARKPSGGYVSNPLNCKTLKPVAAIWLAVWTLSAIWLAAVLRGIRYSNLIGCEHASGIRGRIPPKSEGHVVILVVVYFVAYVILFSGLLASQLALLWRCRFFFRAFFLGSSLLVLDWSKFSEWKCQMIYYLATNIDMISNLEHNFQSIFFISWRYCKLTAEADKTSKVLRGIPLLR